MDLPDEHSSPSVTSRLTLEELLAGGRWRIACLFIGLVIGFYDLLFSGFGAFNRPPDDAPRAVLDAYLLDSAISMFLTVFECILIPLIVIPPIRTRSRFSWRWWAALRFFQVVMASSVFWAASGFYFLGVSQRWWRPIDLAWLLP